MKKIWSVIAVAEPATADAMADALEENSLALSILAPPRTKETRIEALYAEVPNHAAVTMRLAVAAAVHGAKMPKFRICEMPQLDWLKKVAGDFPPLRLARWTVFGAQHRTAVAPSRFNLQIDATSAFGTGEHPTTRGCLVMLEWVLKRKNFTCLANPSPDPSRKGRGTLAAHTEKIFNTRICGKFCFRSLRQRSSPLAGEVRRGVGSTSTTLKLLDLGSGSGILAMAWAQATRGQAIAVDLDPESVNAATDNVRINGLRSYVHVGLSDGYRSSLVKQAAPYDLIMANIFAGPLCRIAKDLKRHLKPGGRAILAGMLNRQANAVLSAHRMQGLRLEKRLVIGEWTILALHRPESAK